MLGSFSFSKLTMGAKASGLMLSSEIRQFISLSSSMINLFLECAHSVVIVAVRYLSLSCPCTKGVASASTAQAAENSSPVLNLTVWGVLSAVTGYAHKTSPCSFLNRNVMPRSSSSRISTVRLGSILSDSEINDGLNDFPVRAISITTKFLIL